MKINKLYTKTGDAGKTRLVGGAEVPKTSVRVEAYGEVDELNSVIGICRTECDIESLTKQLESIQHDLFDIGSDLASLSPWEGMIRVDSNSISKLEGWIDSLTEHVPELTSFVLPGGTKLNSYLHLARSVCRRTERSVLRLAESESINISIPIYLNRLSDFLFAAARFESSEKKVGEYLWIKGGGR